MRRLNLVLLATFQLSRAKQPGFSVHDDLVAYPQYDIVFSESFISEQDAQSLVERAHPNPTYSADFSTPSDLSKNVRDTSTDDQVGESEVAETYEIMNLSPSRYLCAIPLLEPQAPENHTANELARQAEARELAKASAHGWELLNDLDGHCLYFMSGWWSYSFCYNREIVQFHALPTVPNGQPPVRDPHTAEYVLGRVTSAPAGQRRPAQNQKSTPGSVEKPANTDLQVKGDQRYLIQRLDGGTVCDLTGRDRTIEVQYHCVPGMKGDRIGWIKEVTTCAYLMVVNTPRLCADVAFLPPRVRTANPISCQMIIPSDDPNAQAEWHRMKTLEAEEAMMPPLETKEDQALDQKTPDKTPPQQAQLGINIGGVIVGARNVLSTGDEEGKPPTKLAPPRSYLPGRGHGPMVEIIASAKSKAEGGKTEVLNSDELAKLDLDPKLVEEMKQELQKLAGDKGWKLEVVEGPDDPREIRGIVDVDESEEADEAGSKDAAAEEEGSEEKFFREEL